MVFCGGGWVVVIASSFFSSLAVLSSQKLLQAGCFLPIVILPDFPSFSAAQEQGLLTPPHMAYSAPENAC